MAKVLLGQQIQYLENIILVFKKGPGGAITYSSLVTHTVWKEESDKMHMYNNIFFKESLPNITSSISPRVKLNHVHCSWHQTSSVSNVKTCHLCNRQTPRHAAPVFALTTLVSYMWGSTSSGWSGYAGQRWGEVMRKRLHRSSVTQLRAVPFSLSARLWRLRQPWAKKLFVVFCIIQRTQRLPAVIRE